MKYNLPHSPGKKHNVFKDRPFTALAKTAMKHAGKSPSPRKSGISNASPNPLAFSTGKRKRPQSANKLSFKKGQQAQGEGYPEVS